MKIDKKIKKIRLNIDRLGDEFLLEETLNYQKNFNLGILYMANVNEEYYFSYIKDEKIKNFFLFMEIEEREKELIVFYDYDTYVIYNLENENHIKELLGMIKRNKKRKRIYVENNYFYEF